MVEPKFYWKINQQQVDQDNKIFDVINEKPLQVGNDVRLTAKGAVFTQKTMESGITLPACIREEFGTKAFSISIWFKTTSETGNSTLFGNRSDGSHGNFFCIRYARKTIVVELDENDRDGNIYACFQTEPTLGDGKWHQVLVTRENTSQSLYIDGELMSTQQTSRCVDLSKNRNDAYRLGVW